MKQRILLTLTAFVLIGSMVAVGCAAPVPAPTPSPTPSPAPTPTPSPPAEEVFNWKIQCAFGEADCDWYVNLTGLKRFIEEGSGGRVQVELFPIGVLCDPDSIVDSVAMGAIEGGHIIAGMAADRVPSCLGSEMPFGARDRYEHHELHYPWGLLDIMREEYATQNLHLLNVFMSGQLAFQSSFPINTADDLKGKKIWSIPNCTWLTEFGASTVEVPGMDMYMAMKLGTIDGFTWTVGELEFYNYKEVVKYVMQPRLLTPTTHILVNLDAWNALGPDLQMHIQDRIDAHIFELAKEYETYDAKSLAAAKAYGVQFVTLPPAEVSKMQAVASGFWDEVASMSPSAAKMIESYQAYLKYRGITW